MQIDLLKAPLYGIDHINTICNETDALNMEAVQDYIQTEIGFTPRLGNKKS
jgi:hypothetical protein